ncbi:MAG: hypothetical protein MUC62_00075 [Candidatus Thermoplasmatota archaeon]|nr:hypothetical protein [Candidatus Thermoplasmatota archaeon]
MDRPPVIVDLRKAGEKEVRFHISMTLAFILGGVLVSSGIIIALVLPELFAEEENGTEEGAGELPVLMTLTMDEVKIGNNNLSNAPFQQVLMLLIDGEGPVSGLEGPLREFGREMLTSLVGDGTPFRLRVYTDSGQGALWEMTSLVQLPVDDDPSLQSVEINPQPVSAEQGPMTVTLEIWERGSS